jgi:hypothetical protein
MPGTLIPRKRTASLLVATAVACLSATAQSANDFKTSARVDWHQVGAPLGKFLLMRGDKGLCAIRFLDYQRGQDAQPPTVFNSGEESHVARYEWLYQGDGSGDITKDNVKRGKGRVSSGPLKGIGRLASQSGDPYVKCGPFVSYWLPPTSVSFSSSISCSRARYELAPTKWDEMSQVDIRDPRLKWFRCDENRKSFRITSEEL